MNQISIPVTRESILNAEELLRSHPNHSVGDSPDCPLEHFFTDGIYTRKISIPKGQAIVGKIHNHAHPNVLLKGSVQVATESGGIEVLHGPRLMISPAGTKRALIALTDIEWVTFHSNPTNTEDLQELENNIIAPSFEAYEQRISNQERIN